MIKGQGKKIVAIFCAAAALCLFGCATSGEPDSHKYDGITVLGELEYYDEITLPPQCAMSDHTFVGDELWVFTISDDDHDEFAPVYRYKADIENKDFAYVGKFEHNFGHCNTVDYCAANDTLVLGNGGTENYDITDKVFIIENASRLKDMEKADISEVAKTIDLDASGIDCGQQVNVCWGESNRGKYNIVYVLSNLSWKKHIRKVLLGTGSNALECGKRQRAEEGEFNGTFKVLADFTRDYSRTYCNQGTQYYGGKLYEAMGHDGVYFAVDSLLADGSIATEFVKFYEYDDDGNVSDYAYAEGIALKDGYLFVGSLDYYVHRKILIYKL